MNLAEGVKKYLEVAGDFGRAVPLARFGLSKGETEKLFATWDEDYQINRFMLMTLEAGDDPKRAGKPETYLISGFECSHITFQSDIQKLL
jgi:hypothetical protein